MPAVLFIYSNSAIFLYVFAQGNERKKVGSGIVERMHHCRSTAVVCHGNSPREERRTIFDSNKVEKGYMYMIIKREEDLTGEYDTVKRSGHRN